MDFFDAILQANSNAVTDTIGLQYGIVSAVNDPLKLQRVQVYDQAKGGESASDWLIRGLPFTNFTPPVPKVGDLVIFGYILGDPHHGCYLGVAVNEKNKPVGADSDITVLLGSTKVSVKVDGTVTVEGAKEVTVKATKVILDTTQEITLKSPKLTIESPDINVTTSSYKVAGKQIATVSAVDSRGDTITSKGW